MPPDITSVWDFIIRGGALAVMIVGFGLMIIPMRGSKRRTTYLVTGASHEQAIDALEAELLRVREDLKLLREQHEAMRAIAMQSQQTLDNATREMRETNTALSRLVGQDESVSHKRK